MSLPNQDLEVHSNLVPKKASNKPGFHNQAALKAKGRGQFLEALTANKGGALGKRGLIAKILDSLERDLDSPDPEIYQPARAEALKVAIAMTKDDKGGGLEELLKGGSNIQINFNSWFSSRQGITPPPTPGA